MRGRRSGGGPPPSELTPGWWEVTGRWEAHGAGGVLEASALDTWVGVPPGQGAGTVGELVATWPQGPGLQK